MKYSLLEQHLDGSWWYHGNTFDTWGEADDYRRRWIWWDEKRNKQIIGHEEPLPKETISTYDFTHFFFIGGAPACTIKTDQL